MSASSSLEFNKHYYFDESELCFTKGISPAAPDINTLKTNPEIAAWLKQIKEDSNKSKHDDLEIDANRINDYNEIARDIKYNNDITDKISEIYRNANAGDQKELFETLSLVIKDKGYSKEFLNELKQDITPPSNEIRHDKLPPLETDPEIITPPSARPKKKHSCCSIQ